MEEEFNKLKGISRIDQETKRTHGWYVRVDFKGKKYTKFFSDKKSGGKNISHLLAIKWRDTTEKKLGKIRTNKRMVTLSNSGTGVVGVRLNVKKNQYHVTCVNDQGKQFKTSVSISKYGKKVAFLKACAIRREKENARLGINESK